MADKLIGFSIQKEIDTNIINFDDVFEEVKNYGYLKNDKEIIGAMAITIVDLKDEIKKLKKSIGEK